MTLWPTGAVHDVDLSATARLVADPARARMLGALLDGRALTVGELARLAAVAPATASEHVARLEAAGFVQRRAQGRHRYVALAGADVAAALEALAVISPPLPARTLRTSAAAAALRPARLCYDHLAGELGVRIHDHLVGIGAVAVDADGLVLTAAGRAWFARAGVSVPERGPRRPLLRPCLDWTERRSHLAGALAAALAATAIERGWVRRRAPGERGLLVTADGQSVWDDLLTP